MRDVCPFWNPFSIGGGECPYLSIDRNIRWNWLHLSKEEYLKWMCEDDLIESLILLFCDSLFIERLLIHEYNTCFGDILEELGTYNEAEKYNVNASNINPDYDDAHSDYAMIHDKLNKFGEAEIITIFE